MFTKHIKVAAASLLFVGFFATRGMAQASVRYQPEGDKLEKQVNRPVKKECGTTTTRPTRPISTPVKNTDPGDPLPKRRGPASTTSNQN